MTLLREALARGAASCPVVMITAHGTVDTAVEALKTRRLRLPHQAVRQGRGPPDRRQGAEDARSSRGAGRDARCRRRPARASASSAASPGIAELYAVLERVADTPTTVLITGESGTGKELVARALHEHSSAQGQAVHQGQLRRDPQGADRERALRLRARRVHRRGRRASRGASSSPTAARSSSTRSARSRSRCR